jgi:hypothetical protein
VNKFCLLPFEKKLLDGKIFEAQSPSMKFSRHKLAAKSQRQVQRHCAVVATTAALFLSIVCLSGCVSHHPSSSSSNTASALEFDRLYSAWHHDLETEGDGSDNAAWEIGRPSFRNIVAMGKPALPFLEQKLQGDKDSDGLLAFAVVEICGWNIHDFQAKRNAREFRDNVLRKLRESRMIPDR